MIRCKKCNEEFKDEDSIMVCNRCGAMYHKDCWFSTPTCIVEDCENSRGMPLRGENLDPDMEDDSYIEDLLKYSKSKSYKIKQIIPIIVAVIIFISWICLNSYNDYKKHHNKDVVFTEVK